MPRKKTEELAVMPEAPALPIVPEEAAEQPVTEECLPETAADPVVEDTVPTESVLAEPAEVVTVPEDSQPSESRSAPSANEPLQKDGRGGEAGYAAY